MTGIYWCVLWFDRSYLTWLLSRAKVAREKVDAFSVELSEEDSLRAVFVDAVRSHGGDEADMALYRMDVFEWEDGQLGRLVIPSYKCSAGIDSVGYEGSEDFDY